MRERPARHLIRKNKDAADGAGESGAVAGIYCAFMTASCRRSRIPMRLKRMLHAMPESGPGAGASHAAIPVSRIRTGFSRPPNRGGAEPVMGSQELGFQELGRQEISPGAALYARSGTEMAREALFSAGMMGLAAADRAVSRFRCRNRSSRDRRVFLETGFLVETVFTDRGYRIRHRGFCLIR